MNVQALSRRVGGCALALTAIASPTAQARHAPADPVTNYATTAQIDAATRHHHPDVVQPPTRIVSVVHTNGFDWGDAGIGAAGALGASLVAGGYVLLRKRSKSDRAMTARFES